MIKMKNKSNKKNKTANENEQLPGNPVYSANEDIYSREKKEPLNEEGLPDNNGEKENPSLDNGLDIPGAELDDTDEKIGEEDEENNYYSLGGENHQDLEEDKGV
jgi:hypothetical protein